MSKSLPKLVVHKETLRVLSSPELSRVLGGFETAHDDDETNCTPGTNTCPGGGCGGTGGCVTGECGSGICSPTHGGGCNTVQGHC